MKDQIIHQAVCIEINGLRTGTPSCLGQSVFRPHIIFMFCHYGIIHGISFIVQHRCQFFYDFIPFTVQYKIPLIVFHPYRIYFLYDRRVVSNLHYRFIISKKFSSAQSFRKNGPGLPSLRLPTAIQPQVVDSIIVEITNLGSSITICPPIFFPKRHITRERDRVVLSLHFTN